MYHTFNREGTEGYKSGHKTLMNEFTKPQVTTEEFLNGLEKKGYRWGVSDGN